MHLPVNPPVAPMLAKPVPQIPDGPFSFEPKWDGFRSIVFADWGEIEIGSRNERPMTRYFPELVAALSANLPPRCVVDGEIVIPDRDGQRLDFEALLQRIHPAASRVALLASQTPAHFVAFDLLALEDDDLCERPFAERRRLLEQVLAKAAAPVHLTPATTDRGQAEEWFRQFEGAGLDGLIAKSLDGTYQPDKRAMFKIKHERTADCVVAGYRLHKSGPDAIGSLLLGLYTAEGRLASVGVVGAFPLARRRELFAELQPLVTTFDGHPWRWAARPGPAAAGATRGRRRRAAGTPARTCPSCRCGPSWWWKCATTTWRAPGSGTPPSSSAGARTGTQPPAPSPSSRSRSATTWPRSSRSANRTFIRAVRHCAPHYALGWRR